MSHDEQDAEILIKEISALIDERNLIEKELVSNVESTAKIRLSVRRDEIIAKLKKLTAKAQTLSSALNSSTIVSEVVNEVIGTAVGILISDNNVVTHNISIKDSRSLKPWWHNILRKYGKYPCYAVFLLLPSDREAITYLSEFGKELDLLSGKECLVIAFGKTEFKGPKFDKEIWSTVVDEHVSDGISISLAKKFNVDFTQFPCLIVFKDIRSPQHVVITLKDYTSDNIAKSMRQIFSTISKAISQKQDPVHALSLLRKSENFQKTGLSIVSDIKSFAGKTLETTMEAFIKANIQ